VERIWVARALIAAAVLSFLWWWPVPGATSAAVEKSPRKLGHAA